MSKKTTSPSNKAYFTKYKAEGLAKKNQDKKLTKHLKKHPEDRQATDRPEVNYKKGGRHGL